MRGCDMIRHFIAITAFALCALAGLGRSRLAKRRCELLAELVGLIAGFSVKIRCTAPTLAELIEQENGLFAQLVREERAGGDIRAAWAAGCGRLAELPFCHKEEAALMQALGQALGKSDRAGAVQTLELYEGQLSALYEAARAEYEEKGRLFRSVGALCGLGAAIMMW